MSEDEYAHIEDEASWMSNPDEHLSGTHLTHPPDPPTPEVMGVLGHHRTRSIATPHTWSRLLGRICRHHGHTAIDAEVI